MTAQRDLQTLIEGFANSLLHCRSLTASHFEQFVRVSRTSVLKLFWSQLLAMFWERTCPLCYSDPSISLYDFGLKSTIRTKSEQTTQGLSSLINQSFRWLANTYYIMHATHQPPPKGTPYHSHEVGSTREGRHTIHFYRSSYKSTIFALNPGLSLPTLPERLLKLSGFRLASPLLPGSRSRRPI